MRLRLPSRSQAWLRRRSTKGLIGLGIVGVTAILLVGGGAYALLGGFAQTSSTSDINLQKGLVGWWKLDGNTKDATPYGDNGTATNTTLTTDRKGRANGAYNFNGTTSSINCTSAAVLQPTAAVTISAWIYPTAYNSTNGIVNFGAGGYWLDLDATGHAVMYISSNFTATTTSTIPLNQWHHIVATYDGTNSTIYVDGVQKATSTAITGPITNYAGLNCYIGTIKAVAGRYFQGSIDDVRIYNRALSAAEANALANQYDAQVNAAGGESGLVGWWKMDGNGKDSTPYGDNVTANNVTLTTDRKGAANSAYSFNGTNASLTLGDKDSLDIGTGSKSWSTWFKTSSSATQYLYRKSDSCNVNGMLSYISSGSVVSQITTGGNCTGDTTVTVQSPSNAYADGNWHLMTTVLDRTANTLKLYVDGSAVNSASAAALTGINLNAGNSVTIGSSYGNVSPLTGSLDDLRIYSRALTATDVVNVFNSYNSQINLNSSPTNQSTVNLNSGLVGYWPFNGNAKDVTPYSNNGTLVNTPALTTDRNARANSAYSFNGTNQYMNLGTSPTLTPPNISISVWAKANTLGSWNGILSNMTSWGTGFGLQMGTANNIAAMISGTYLKTSWVPSTGVWYHIVATHNATTNANVLYVNGNQEALSNHAVTYEASAKTYIGVFYTSPGLYFNGTIDDVRIYNRDLSAPEVTALYNNYY